MSAVPNKTPRVSSGVPSATGEVCDTRHQRSRLLVLYREGPCKIAPPPFTGGGGGDRNGGVSQSVRPFTGGKNNKKNSHDTSNA